MHTPSDSLKKQNTFYYLVGVPLFCAAFFRWFFWFFMNRFGSGWVVLVLLFVAVGLWYVIQRGAWKYGSFLLGFLFAQTTNFFRLLAVLVLLPVFHLISEGVAYGFLKVTAIMLSPIRTLVSLFHSTQGSPIEFFILSILEGCFFGGLFYAIGWIIKKKRTRI